jgi:hypothetical protein
VDDIYAGVHGQQHLLPGGPIAAWGKPVLIWSSFICVLLFVMLCLNAILRSRWMDREKLTYPIVHLPLEMTSERQPIFRSRLMWIGFGIAALIDSVNGLHGFFPVVPEIKVRVVHFDAYMSPLQTRERPRRNADLVLPFAVGMGPCLDRPPFVGSSSFWRLQSS